MLLISPFPIVLTVSSSQGKCFWNGQCVEGFVSAFFSLSVSIKPTPWTQRLGALTLFYGFRCCLILELEIMQLRSWSQIVILSFHNQNPWEAFFRVRKDGTRFALGFWGSALYSRDRWLGELIEGLGPSHDMNVSGKQALVEINITP